MPTPNPYLSLSHITGAISDTVGALNELELQSIAAPKRAKLVNLLEAISAIIETLAECEEEGEDSYIPRWLRTGQAS